eukprot:GHUV01047555.1.p1 GENE.GHUV01047555.1~~GHUV01047555.1.p1  ORF type:complete len:165 (+),score=58.04 GHUV01047555.1:213-707(+)
MPTQPCRCTLPLPQVRQAQQMSTLVARKKSELSAKLERLQEKRDTLAATLDSSKAAAGGSITGGISDEDWRAKYEQIKSQLPNYKAMKKELSELEAEAFTLSRTVEILQQQENEMKRAVHKQEQKAGVQVGDVLFGAMLYGVVIHKCVLRTVMIHVVSLLVEAI